MSETALEAPGQDAETEPAGINWGRVLDVAGIGAGVVLVFIVADIVTDGRLISRRLQRRRGDDTTTPESEMHDDGTGD